MKTQLRKNILKQRSALKAKHWIELSEAICKNVLQSQAYQNANCIALYSTLNQEVDCTVTFEAAKSEGKTCAFPRTESGELTFHKIKSLDELQPGDYGILAPNANTPTINPDELDLILCPGSAFDKKGNRIGYGKGYYDKYLKQTSATKIGLAFSFQIVDDVPAEDHDVPMDIIVTEKGLIHP